MKMAGEQEAQSYDTPEAAVAAGLFSDLDEDEKKTDDSGDTEDVNEDDEGAQEEDVDEDAGEEDAGEDDSEGEDETEIQTLEDLAAASELEAKDLDGLEVNLTIDGEETTMTVGDLRDMAKTNRQEQWTGAFQELAEKTRETGKSANKLAEQQKQAAAINARLLEEIERTLLGDQNELARLAQDNSPFYARKHQELDRKMARIEEIKRVVGLQQEDAQGRDSAAMEARRKTETDLLFMFHPELRSDEKAAQKAMGDIGQIMFKLGWSPDEIKEAAMDHRLIRLALMATQSVPPEKKALDKVRKKFKRPKGKAPIPSKRKSVRSQASKKRSAKALDRLAKTGDEDAFVDSLVTDGLV